MLFEKMTLRPRLLKSHPITSSVSGQSVPRVSMISGPGRYAPFPATRTAPAPSANRAEATRLLLLKIIGLERERRDFPRPPAGSKPADPPLTADGSGTDRQPRRHTPRTEDGGPADMPVKPEPVDETSIDAGGGQTGGGHKKEGAPLETDPRPVAPSSSEWPGCSGPLPSEFVQIVSFFKGVRLSKPLHRHTEMPVLHLHIVKDLKSAGQCPQFPSENDLWPNPAGTAEGSRGVARPRRR